LIPLNYLFSVSYTTSNERLVLSGWANAVKSWSRILRLLRIDLSMIAFLTLELRIEAAQSLKDKRQVTRSLKDRLRASFNIGVAELDPGPLWNQATIGVVSVSHSRDYLDGLMKNVERAATRIANNAGAEVTDSFVEFL
jgi:uncharacterized protein YlxP (DUF503 family)